MGHSQKMTPLAPGSYALGFIIVSLIIYICKIAADIIIPFVIAVFVWYLINAIARFLGAIRFQSGYKLPSKLRYVLSMLAICAVTLMVVKMVGQNIEQVSHEAPKFQESFEKIIRQTAGILKIEHVPTMRELIDDVITKYIDIEQVITGFAAMLTDMTGKTLVVLFFVGFLLYEQRFFDRKMKWMIRDDEKQKKIRAILSTIDVKVQKYIGVKAFVSFCDSLLTYFILSAFGVDFAAFWGVMAFFLHFIPYAGSFVAISMPVLISFIQFGDLGIFLAVLASLCVSHAFLGHILDPYLMGNNLNLSPIFIITNLALWAMIWGVPGMFLAIPILAIVALTLEQFPSTRPLAILMSKTGVLGSAKPAALKKL